MKRHSCDEPSVLTTSGVDGDVEVDRQPLRKAHLVWRGDMFTIAVVIVAQLSIDDITSLGPDRKLGDPRVDWGVNPIRESGKALYHRVEGVRSLWVRRIE